MTITETKIRTESSAGTEAVENVIDKKQRMSDVLQVGASSKNSSHQKDHRVAGGSWVSTGAGGGSPERRPLGRVLSSMLIPLEASASLSG